jgi:hypothetical protein
MYCCLDAFVFVPMLEIPIVSLHVCIRLLKLSTAALHMFLLEYDVL